MCDVWSKIKACKARYTIRVDCSAPQAWVDHFLNIIQFNLFPPIVVFVCDTKH